MSTESDYTDMMLRNLASINEILTEVVQALVVESNVSADQEFADLVRNTLRDHTYALGFEFQGERPNYAPTLLAGHNKVYEKARNWSNAVSPLRDIAEEMDDALGSLSHDEFEVMRRKVRSWRNRITEIVG
jgi:hypothetical protein